jgi:hypothetical protein
MGNTSYATAYMESGHHPAFEGDMSYQNTLGWDNTDNAVVALMHKLNQKWHPDVKFRAPIYVDCWQGAMIFCEVLRRAIDQYGIKNMTGPNIKKTFETIKEFDVGGLSTPITYTTWDHQGNHSLRWVRYEKGKLIPVTPFVKTPTLSDEERDYKYWLKD